MQVLDYIISVTMFYVKLQDLHEQCKQWFDKFMNDLWSFFRLCDEGKGVFHFNHLKQLSPLAFVPKGDLFE